MNECVIQVMFFFSYLCLILITNRNKKRREKSYFSNHPGAVRVISFMYIYLYKDIFDLSFNEKNIFSLFVGQTWLLAPF